MVRWLLMACWLFLPAQVTYSQDSVPGTTEIPTFLVNSNTKQFYRFHFSGLQPTNAMKLAQQVWPVVAKLPEANPLRRALVTARDAGTFAEMYRTLRNCFLEQRIDTIYFQAEDHWINSTTLPGYIIMPGTPATFERLKTRLTSQGLRDWATFLGEFQPARGNPGWMVRSQGTVSPGAPAPGKVTGMQHTLRVRCPIRPAAVQIRNLPQVVITLGETYPVTIINLERNQLDNVLNTVLPALAPSMARTVELSNKALATTFVISVHPFVYVTQIVHMPNPRDAANLANEMQRNINGAVNQVVEAGEEFGPLIGLFARSMVSIGVQEKDVILVMKPPALFDMNMAQREARETQEQDWTALPAPTGMHWEMVTSVGNPQRYDAMMRVASIQVKGSSSKITPEAGSTGADTFRVPLGDNALTLKREARGVFTFSTAKNDKTTRLPALECFNEQNRLVAVLRLDLQAGDTRFDLARTRAVLQRRIEERSEAEKQAAKEVDKRKNEKQEDSLKNPGRINVTRMQQLDDGIRVAEKLQAVHHAALTISQAWASKIVELQTRFPAATLAKDGELLTVEAEGRSARPADMRFAGLWLFDYGVLTLYQNSKGTVVGSFTSQSSDYRHEMIVSAVVTGQAPGNTLTFSLSDVDGRTRGGKIELGPDALSGTWSLDAYTYPGTAAARGTSGPSSKTPMKKNPFKIDPPIMSDPVRRLLSKNEPARKGRIDWLDIGTFDPSWAQEGDGSALVGYWVHPTNKEMNTLIKAGKGGYYECTGAGTGMMPTIASKLAGVGVGHIMFLLPSQKDGLHVRIARLQLSSDKQSLTLDQEADPATPSNTLTPRSAPRPVVLTRDK